MRKYVLTGGPGSGKSSILLCLEMEGHAIIREAAEDYIKLRQAEGIEKPWEEDRFQEEIMQLQIRREETAPKRERIFIDRGIPDGLAYQARECAETRRISACADDGYCPDGLIYSLGYHDHYARIERAAKESSYDLVFIIEQLETTEKNGVRRESHDEAKKLELKFEEIYKRLGYKPIRIPAGDVEDRAGHILHEAMGYERYYKNKKGE